MLGRVESSSQFGSLRTARSSVWCPQIYDEGLIWCPHNARSPECEGPLRCRKRPLRGAMKGGLLLAHVLRLQAFRTLHDFELHAVTFAERAEAVSLDGGVVDEDVLAALL